MLNKEEASITLKLFNWLHFSCVQFWCKVSIYVFELLFRCSFIVLSCKLLTRNYLFSAFKVKFCDIVTVMVITPFNSIFYIFIAFVPRLYLRCHCCWFVIVLNSNFRRFFTGFIPFGSFVLWHCHSYHIVSMLLMSILEISFTVFTLKMASCMCKPNI